MQPPNVASNQNDPYSYQSGYRNNFESEALPGALPVGQNSPQVCPYKLYAEQINGTAFTAPRHSNLKTWFYRMRPGVCHKPFVKVSEKSNLARAFGAECDEFVTPNQIRWSPFDIPESDKSVDFVQGLSSVAGAGDPCLRSGLGIHVYVANASMKNKAFYNSDGDLLIVPQQGRLDIKTEMGRLNVAPNEIVVIPRGIRFSVALPDGPVRGYICEVYSGSFEIPDLGPIGSNGLANPRDFLAPVAYYEEIEEKYEIYNKYQGHMFKAEQDHSPFDVVAWHGNYYPFKYDLNRFNAVNSVTFDHIDPCIFTVLTVKSAVPGTGIMDFAIFPPRWAVQDWTFRPPYYHKNTASEFMGLIKGEYEAKKGGFVPGGASLHSMMTPHGPDARTFEQASTAALVPVRVADGTQAFMFETSLMLRLTKWGLEESKKVQPDYNEKAWGEVKKVFDINYKPSAK